MKRITVLALVASTQGVWTLGQSLQYDPNDVLIVDQHVAGYAKTEGDSNCEQEYVSPAQPSALEVPLLALGPNVYGRVNSGSALCESTRVIECASAESEAISRAQNGFAVSAAQRTISYSDSGYLSARAAAEPDTCTNEHGQLVGCCGSAIAWAERNSSVYFPFVVSDPGWLVVQTSGTSRSGNFDWNQHGFGWEIQYVCGQAYSLYGTQSNATWSGNRSFAVSAGTHMFAASANSVLSTGGWIGCDTVNGTVRGNGRVTVRYTTREIPAGQPAFFERGDVNGDFVVNYTDLARVLSKFGICLDTGIDSNGDPLPFDPSAYDPEADLNGDGCIDTTDLATVLANYGSTLPY